MISRGTPTARIHPESRVAASRDGACDWIGYHGSAPVRSHNLAADQVQNDAYGEMILTFTPIFFDERFVNLRTRDLDSLLTHLTQLCARSIGRQDAGP